MLFVTFEEHRLALARISQLEAQLSALRAAMGRLLSNAKVDKDLSLEVTGNLVASRIHGALTVAAQPAEAHAPVDAADPR